MVFELIRLRTKLCTVHRIWKSQEGCNAMKIDSLPQSLGKTLEKQKIRRSNCLIRLWKNYADVLIQNIKLQCRSNFNIEFCFFPVTQTLHEITQVTPKITQKPLKFVIFYADCANYTGLPSSCNFATLPPSSIFCLIDRVVL